MLAQHYCCIANPTVGSNGLGEVNIKTMLQYTTVTFYVESENVKIKVAGSVL